MFDWLEKELSAIKTPRFHVTDGPVDAELRKAVIQSNLPLPRSYREFVLRFGNTKLYRRAQSESYQLGVFAGPRAATLSDGTSIHHLGFHDGASVYVKSAPHAGEPPIFEFEESEERVSESFEEWLTAGCARARNSYGDANWTAILRGPEPFTARENEMIAARRQIHWRVQGIDANGNHVFEVTNDSSRAFSTLKVGVRSKDRRLNGAVLLKIGHIGPSKTGVLHVDCYSNLVSLGEIEVFAVPDPQPEDREQYPELGGA
jgi:hypothetical protein